MKPTTAQQARIEALLTIASYVEEFDRLLVSGHDSLSLGMKFPKPDAPPGEQHPHLHKIYVDTQLE